MINGISVVIPFDIGRTNQFVKTIAAYQKWGIPNNVEFIIVSRTYKPSKDNLPFGDNHFRVVNYEFEGEYFNPAKALNLGVKNAKYDNIIITCPEVIPKSNIFEKIDSLKEGNYIFQVFDEFYNGECWSSLVNSNYRSNDPAMYFFALFRKQDILKINGWDEDFMKGYAWEDSDFGVRWNNARIPFSVVDDVNLMHQFHVRGVLNDGWRKNQELYEKHVKENTTWIENGILKTEMVEHFNDHTILVTGGTGSFGSAFVRRILKESNPKKIIVYSRDEAKQHKLNLELNSPIVKFVIGDVRDKERLRQVMPGVDYVFHAAAMKQVPACEFNPVEAILTNTIGTNNVIDVSIEFGVKKVIGLSTDKAVNPFSALGMSKGLMEKIITARARDSKNTILCTTRFGNLLCSNGSVVPTFIKQAKEGSPLTVTCSDMLRFLMRIDDAIDLVLFAFTNGQNGSIYVKKAPVCKLGDIVTSVINLTGSKSKPIEMGVRHGEKMDEVLISSEEMIRTEDCGQFYRILPDTRGIDYISYSPDILIKKGFEYNTLSERLLTQEQVQRMLAELPEFKREL